MGSEVVPGYKCKPVKKDPNRPIMYYRHHLLLCNGQRCKEALGERNLSEEIRGELEDLGLHRGENRIKVTSGNCFGACRFRAVAVVYENNGPGTNNSVWIRRLHLMDGEKRNAFYRHLESGQSLADSPEFQSSLIPMEQPGD